MRERDEQKKRKKEALVEREKEKEKKKKKTIGPYVRLDLMEISHDHGSYTSPNIYNNAMISQFP